MKRLRVKRLAQQRPMARERVDEQARMRSPFAAEPQKALGTTSRMTDLTYDSTYRFERVSQRR